MCIYITCCGRAVCLDLLNEYYYYYCVDAAELGDSSSDSGKDKTKKKRCTLCKKRVGLTGQ